jgi:hypothetical protein
LNGLLRVSGLLKRAAQQFQYFKNDFCISKSLSPPNTTHARLVIHQPPFLSLSTASIMKFNSCESAIGFTNPRIHAGHTNLHDPINDHMTTHRSDSVICEFSAVWLLCLQLFVVLLSWLSSPVIDLKFDGLELRRQKPIIGVSL